jgi:hypothetical protein
MKMASSHMRQAGQSIGPEEPAENAVKASVEVLHIDGRLSDDLALSRPIGIEIWTEDGEYVADVAEFNRHAFGATREEAIVNIRGQIAERYRRLRALGDQLSPLMKQEAARLQAIILPERNGVPSSVTLSEAKSLGAPQTGAAMSRDASRRSA